MTSYTACSPLLLSFLRNIKANLRKNFLVRALKQSVYTHTHKDYGKYIYIYHLKKKNPLYFVLLDNDMFASDSGVILFLNVRCGFCIFSLKNNCFQTITSCYVLCNQKIWLTFLFHYQHLQVNLQYVNS